jgi:hypothetical protein
MPVAKLCSQSGSHAGEVVHLAADEDHGAGRAVARLGLAAGDARIVDAEREALAAGLRAAESDITPSATRWRGTAPARCGMLLNRRSPVLVDAGGRALGAAECAEAVTR